MSLGQRRLAAIMFTDMVGYTALGQSNEALSLALADEQRKLVRPILARHNGREIKTMGDAFLVEFASALDAVRCAYDVQRGVREFNFSMPEERRLHLRIGVHLGDVVESEGDISGDAVNVASRIEPLAADGGVCLTRQVQESVKGKLDLETRTIGMKSLKNVREPMEVFELVMPWSGNPEQAKEEELEKSRVAILPFRNMSPDPNDGYFAEGITEELISTVSKINELTVISRTSVMRYRDLTAPISQIGHELKVGTILEGSVRKASNKIRITAQLIDVKSDGHLWSQNYDRELTDIFAIQSDIAEQVAGSLKVQLLKKEKQSIRKEATRSTEAYTLYLKGRFYWGERTEENTKKALRYFEEATRVDPEYAMAYSGISDAYSILSDYGWMAPKEALPLAMSNAKKALELDDGLAEAHASMGLVLSNYKWDLKGAEKELKLAIELKPNYASALHWYAVDLFYMRRYKESIDTASKAFILDPYSRILNMITANQLLFFPERYDEAIKRYGELIEAYPDMSALRYWRSTAYVVMGRKQDALKEAEEYVKMEGGGWTSNYSNMHLAWVCASIGEKEMAERLLQEALELREKSSVSATGIGWAKVVLGEDNEGYEWLERAFEEEDPALLYFNGFPWAKAVRSDPRWKSIESRFPFKSAPE